MVLALSLLVMGKSLFSMKKFFTVLLFLLISQATTAGVFDTVAVHFSFNQSKLDNKAIQLLDSLIYYDVLIHGQRYAILGYTDYVGGDVYNQELSQKRAQSVKGYLVKMGFLPADIKVCIGKGKTGRVVAGEKDGLPEDRKVQIIIDGNPYDKPEKDTMKVLAAEKKIQPAKLDLSTVKVNQSIALKKILFVGGRHDFLPESIPVLDSFCAQMKCNPTVKIEIQGHICCLMPDEGSDSQDPVNSMPLSYTRAKAVYSYLASKGIAASRMACKGYGYTRPIYYPEKNEAERMANRRVEIKILSK